MLNKSTLQLFQGYNCLALPNSKEILEKFQGKLSIIEKRPSRGLEIKVISNALNVSFSCRQNVLFHHLFYLSLSPELEILLAWFMYIRTIRFHLSILSLAHTCHTRTPPKICFFLMLCVHGVFTPASITHTTALPLPPTAGQEKNKGRVKAKQLMVETVSLTGERRREGGKKQQKTNKQQKTQIKLMKLLTAFHRQTKAQPVFDQPPPSNPTISYSSSSPTPIFMAGHDVIWYKIYFGQFWSSVPTVSPPNLSNLLGRGIEAEFNA